MAASLYREQAGVSDERYSAAQSCGSSADAEELIAMLQPYYTPKTNYTTQPPVAMLTKVFWDEATFAPVAVQRDRLSRSAKVLVYSYQEQGE
jgi:hypothetical protein